jgi:hypothetical protein
MVGNTKMVESDTLRFYHFLMKNKTYITIMINFNDTSNSEALFPSELTQIKGGKRFLGSLPKSSLICKPIKNTLNLSTFNVVHNYINSKGQSIMIVWCP